ncbi:MAG: type I DNA topoisomerase [Bacilli bacterium]|nr:type I DNA topoisomerase [Bacilli bacterium]
MKLVIVESPTKCETIKRYLGEDYVVKASYGHIRDLATKGKGGLGIDIEHNFAPAYVINNDKRKVVYDLKKVADESEEVILATDPDREGEAIAWHLAQVLGLNVKTNKRLEFHEITRDSINEALKTPRTIDLDLVASQETRRMLDRIIGFKLSSLLNKKIHSKSAGRVQSATLKLVYDQELEIEKFVPEEYWKINVSVLLNNKEFELTFVSDETGKKNIDTKEEAEHILSLLKDKLEVTSVETVVKTVESKVPFTTSTLQQEAFSRLKFKTDKTQRVAQSLYEGISVNGEHVGLITYMRTDSTRLAPIFIERASKYIIETYGKEYLGKPKAFKAGELTQDAHEAIRPTSNHRTPESVRSFLTPEQYNLYKLIYNRTLASLMKGKKEETLVVQLSSNGVKFKLEFTRTLFPGYEIIYKDEDEIKHYKNLPSINVKDELTLVKKEIEQKFTTPPSRYSEAKIVKLMEEVGIGRPSTYASTISTLKKRKYVDEEKGILIVTDQGKKTAHVLEKYFPNIVNAKYTADMETKLDTISEGDSSSLDILSNFYTQFMDQFNKVQKVMYVDDPIPTGELCPKCGSPLIYKEGKNGQFVGCSNYPECKYVQKEKKEVIYTGDTCPECGKPLVERKDAKGKVFVACSGYPRCKYIVKEEKPAETPTEFVKKCPDCETGQLIKKKGKYGYFLGCTNYPTCNHMEKLLKKRRK